MLYLCGYVGLDSLTLLYWLAARVAGKKLRVLPLLYVPWHISIKWTDYQDRSNWFHRGGGCCNSGLKKVHLFPPVNQAQAQVMQMACCEHGLKRTDLLRTWSVFNCGLFWTGALWTWSVINVHGLLCTWFVMNVVCYERGLFWTWSAMN